MTEAEVILMGVISGFAYWKRNSALLWFAAAACAGLMGAMWWGEEVAFGLPTCLLSGVLFFKGLKEVMGW